MTHTQSRRTLRAMVAASGGGERVTLKKFLPILSLQNKNLESDICRKCADMRIPHLPKEGRYGAPSRVVNDTSSAALGVVACDEDGQADRGLEEMTRGGDAFGGGRLLAVPNGMDVQRAIAARDLDALHEAVVSGVE